MKPAIAIAMPITERLRARLAEIGDLHETPPGTTGIISDAAKAEARVLVTLGTLRTDAALIASMPKLGLICCYGTGFEGVDRQAAAARGIPVTHAGDTNATAVAEFAMGLMLATARLIPRGDRLVRGGNWKDLKLGRLPMVPGLAGRRLGIYGLGAIGERIARRAEPFEMEIAYHNRRRRDDVPWAYKSSLMELAEWCDVLMVSVRAMPENRHAVNAAVLEALGPKGLLVNISRGIAVDEAALVEALEQGRIAGAGLDVFEQEPHVPPRLFPLENVVLTPHVAALCHSAQDAQADLLVSNITAFLSGGALRCLVPPA